MKQLSISYSEFRWVNKISVLVYTSGMARRDFDTFFAGLSTCLLRLSVLLFPSSSTFLGYKILEYISLAMAVIRTIHSIFPHFSS